MCLALKQMIRLNGISGCEVDVLKTELMFVQSFIFHRLDLGYHCVCVCNLSCQMEIY